MDGCAHPDFLAVEETFRNQLDKTNGGAAVAVYHRGEKVVDLWGGARTNEGVDERLRNEAAAGAFLDLFTIGWDVLRTVLDPATDRETPHDDGGDADEPTGGH